jgi:hypothetical protein
LISVYHLILLGYLVYEVQDRRLTRKHMVKVSDRMIDHVALMRGADSPAAGRPAPLPEVESIRVS